MAFDRRTLLSGGAMLALAAVTGMGRAATAPAKRPKGPFQISEDAWRKRLTPVQYASLREAATERPYSSPLNAEHRKGTFLCVGCDQKLFDSSTKFESHTGWPSFWRPLPKAIGTSIDHDLGFARTEVHCARCGGHHGHVFKDGPPPTGLRYCMNGVSLKFVPA